MNNLRQRYILVEFISKSSLDIGIKQLKKELWNNFIILFGELNSFKAGIYVPEYEPKEQRAIIRCDHDQEERMITMLTMLTELGGTKVVCHTWKTTGTIKKARELWAGYCPIPWC